MAEDGEILRQIWYSYLPVVFRLSASDVSSLQEPDPYYLMVPRLSYFSLVIDKVIKHLSRFVFESKQTTNDLWLESEGIPLKWHYPIGLLWDLYGTDLQLPWNITVHFQNFPEDVLIRCNSRAAMESAFMSCVKEADALKHRSNVISSMQKKDHNQLWLGVVNDKFDQFWAINRKLMEHTSNEESFRHIPYRVYTSEYNILQKLIKPNLENGDKTTLKDLVNAIFKDNADKYKIVIHGIEPPLETPLQWLSEHMSYADNFLHICARNKSDQNSPK